MSRGRRIALGGAIALVAVIAAAALLVGNGDGNGDEAPVDTAVPNIEHVHGLGVNPGEDALYVATHFGTFVVNADGDVARVGESYQDTMGFTVVGEDHFLGSGHPDVAGMRAGQPGRLGLIESRDAGATWTEISLGGEADFHALAAVDGVVYGWDAGSGRLLASSDNRSWEERSVVELTSFAASPDDAEHIVAAASPGVQASTDGGRTWTTMGGPDVVVLSWAPSGTLWGAARDGVVHRSDDGGTTWQEAGDLPGAPQALLATTAVLWAAAEDDGATSLLRSTDGGATWDRWYRDDAGHAG